MFQNIVIKHGRPCGLGGMNACLHHYHCRAPGIFPLTMSRLGCSSLLLLAWMSQADNCGDWSSWSTCSQTCGLGVQTQTYSATNTGTGCQWADGQSQTQPCQVQSCLSQPPGVFTSISSVVFRQGKHKFEGKTQLPPSFSIFPSLQVFFHLSVGRAFKKSPNESPRISQESPWISLELLGIGTQWRDSTEGDRAKNPTPEGI